MSQTKAQLIQPIGVVTASGVVVSGVMTAVTFDGDIVGSATSVIQGKNLNLGTFNATSFAGDFTGNATGIITSSAIKVGQLTASSFVGDFTGTATSMAKGTGFEAGTVTSTAANVTYTVTVSGGDFYLDSLQQPTPTLYPGATYTFDQSDSTNGTHPLRFATAADAAGSTEYTDGVTTNGTPGSAGAWTKIVVPRNAPTPLYYYCSNHSGMGASINITNQLQGAVTGDVTGSATGIAGTVVQGTNIHVGVITATTLYGDGSNLTGIAATNLNTQTVTVSAATTTIDLSAGNMVTFNQSADTTVSLANTSEAMDVTLIRSPESTSFSTFGVGFNGSSESLELPDSTDFDFDTGDFTVELWVYLSANSSNNPVLIGANGGWYIQLKTGDTIVEFYTGSTSHSDTSTALSTGTWHHIAAARSGTTLKVFVDGTERISATESGAVDIGNKFYIGMYGGGTLHFTGSISNVRVTKGQALYTADFAVPQSALTTTSQGATASNVKLLCCNNQYIRGATKSPNISGVNDGTVWSSGTFLNVSDNSPVIWATNSPVYEMFNGGLTSADSAYQASYQDWYWTMPDIPCTSTFRFNANNSGSPGDVVLVTDAGTASVTPAAGNAQWNSITLPGGTTKLTKLTVPQTNNSNWTDMVAIEVDGVVLIDPVVGTPANPPAFNTDEDADSVTIGTESAMTITWPSSVKWNGGGTPTLLTYDDAGDTQQFQFLTRDSGLTWYAWEPFSYDPPYRELWIWGRNVYGQQGNNDTTARSSPVQLPGNWNQATFASNMVYSTKFDNTLWAWGENHRGQLGQNDNVNRSSPTQIPGSTWSNVTAGSNAVLAIKTNGTLWSWGYNYVGMLAQNTNENSQFTISSPKQVGTDTTWSQTTGVSNKLSIKTDGTLWSWGYNNIGGSGLNDIISRSSPTQVGTNTNWSKISTGHRQTAFGIKTDGTLWGWGSGDNKVLNSTNNNHKSSPVQLGTNTTWKSVYQYSEGIQGFKTDGTLWMWGYNNQGQLGQNSLTTYSSPIQIPGTTWTGDAYTGPNFTLTTKTDGTLWAWGANDTGQFGQDNTTYLSSPTQIPGTTWDYSKIFYQNYSQADTAIGFKQLS